MIQYPTNAATSAGATAKTIYTCPAGRTAIVKTINATNNHGAAVLATASFLDGGVTSVALSTNISVGVGASANLLTDALCLTAGESIQVNANNSTGNGIIRWGKSTDLADTVAYSLGAGTQISGIVYANSLYVAYGIRTGAGLIATSSDAVTWTIRAFGGTTTISDVAFGNGVWVATLNTVSVVYTSTDAITWTSRAHPNAQIMTCVAYGGGKWLIAGDAGTGATATDPTSTWTNNASITTQASSNNILCVQYSAWLGLWVLGVTTTGVITATDPASTWAVRTVALGVRTIADNGSSRLVAFTNNTNTGWTSTNGTTWVAMASPYIPVNTTASSYGKRSLIFANGMFVLTASIASSPAAGVSTSVDGLTWLAYGTSTVTVSGVVAIDNSYLSPAYGSAGWVSWSSGAGKISTPLAAVNSDNCATSFVVSAVEVQ